MRVENLEENRTNLQDPGIQQDSKIGIKRNRYFRGKTPSDHNDHKPTTCRRQETLILAFRSVSSRACSLALNSRGGQLDQS
jgi:hypothetical protein